MTKRNDNPYDASFTCSEGRKWIIKFNIGQVADFCESANIQIDGFDHGSLNFKQHLFLVWLGISHHTDSKRYTTSSEFADECLKGEVLTEALNSLALGMLNFTLPRLPLKRAIKAVEIIEELMGIKGNILEPHVLCVDTGRPRHTGG
eukprot:TRINITY_DN23358_c0_g1_i1.p1 TRINITY_DN23358_c0_g1~~TRINITY_DN23358_c0_g1_i1.p1  ORF type:complete len:147 (+),score=23.18 TRINITY_DN23358_c0_g1_i1:108-548(+)